MMTRSDLDLFYGKVKFGNLGFSMGKSENSGFFRKYCPSDLKVGRRRQLVEVIRYVSIEGQGHFFTIYCKVLYVLCFSRPRYQLSVHRTIGPLVNLYFLIF